MAALNIAFDSPETALDPLHGRGRPIDLEHLAHQTMGDKALELEVLQMFARQSRQIVKTLMDGDAEVRKAAAHRLKGAALAVGAFPVAEVAAGVEDRPEEAEGLAALSSAVLDAEIFILKLCR
ncbi:transcriptional regulator [Rhizobium sp. Leaf384]|jgi:HPt (histidine-containing phosphotransfer) domain-containing protein|uniref:Hpt domain-containing protein n=1 Tax=unclassified Rhizobium TaxID=2613769 RepID=UPI0007140A08|nr:MULTISPECIES: Hpt domain-containing protein [unclassified Rhizobium]KQR68779.1 transcriptional regulator [Rhizobium sp. Leaf341]KQS79190.1 transcriptional regulator [Rhizobium sp. Leaf384]KQS82758.1 transcriptional regulator [Rhizobium sp. Leaf383]